MDGSELDSSNDEEEWNSDSSRYRCSICLNLLTSLDTNPRITQAQTENLILADASVIISPRLVPSKG